MKHLFSLVILVVYLNNLSGQLLSHVPHEFLIQLENDIDINVVLEDLGDYDNQIPNAILRRTISKHAKIHLIYLESEAFSDVDLLIHIFSKSYIQGAQLNQWLSARTIPDDPYFYNQWHWHNAASFGTTGDVNALDAWQMTTGGLTADGDTIVLALIDDGIDLDHPDLQENLWKNHAEIPNNGIDDDDNGFIDDYSGWNTLAASDYISSGTHGTSVAGMMGAVGNNDLGIAGINWNTKIMPIVRGGAITEADVIEAYNYALEQRMRYNESNGEMGAFVVAANTSWGIDEGSPSDSPLWCSFYDTLGVHGILSIAATSNNNYNIDEVGDLPTTCTSPYLISVTATNNEDIRTSAAYGLEHVDVAAPGEDVLTLATNSGYEIRSGTSFAAPIVTGQVGLIYSMNCGHLGELAKLNPSEAAIIVCNSILQGVDEIPNLTNETLYGGRVNVANSLNLAQNICADCPAPTLLGTSETTLTSTYLHWNTFGQDSIEFLEVRAAGSSDWEVYPFPESPFFIENLTSCTDYEYRVAVVCGSEFIYSPTGEFLTEGCCAAPINIDIIEISDSSASFTWVQNLPDEVYEVQWAYILSNGNTDWETIAYVNTPNFLHDDLQACSDYLMRIKTNCTNGQFMFSTPIEVNTLGCSDCVELDYCSMTALDGPLEYIDVVTINDLIYESGDNDGYGDFTDWSTTLVMGETYTLTLQPGFGSIAYEEHWQVWLDYSQDGIYDYPEELVYATDEALEGIITIPIEIPQNIAAGTARLRIIMNWNETFGEPNPCGEFTYGEVEDYCITIAAEPIQPICLPPSLVDTLLVTDVSAAFYWNGSNMDDYQLQIKQASEEIWQTAEVNGTSHEWFGLMECADYEYRVGIVCPEQVLFTATNTFTTDCTIIATEEDNAYQWGLTIFPNPASSLATVQIESSNMQPIQIAIYNSSGQLFLQQTQDIAAGMTQFQFDVEDLASGLYVVKIETETQTTFEKLLIIRE